jgi:CheY-like chemotaxis protein
MQKENGRTGRRLRVLVADDNCDGADTLAMLLRMSGHETRTAHDGRRALQIASTSWADIAFLDLEMPRLSGYEVARAVRASIHARRMKLVALTGWTRTSDRAKARAAGFDQFLVKPADLADLDALFRELEAS